MDYFKSTSLKQLEQMYKQEKDSNVKTKLLVVIHKKERKKHKDITKSLRVSDSKIKRIIRRFRKEGEQGLCRKEGSGNPGYLTDNQKQKLTEHIEQEQPTSRQINQYIQDNFGETYHPFSIPRLLRNLKFSRITPRKQHYKTDKSKQEEWKQVFKKRSRNTWIWVTESSSKTNQ